MPFDAGNEFLRGKIEVAIATDNTAFSLLRMCLSQLSQLCFLIVICQHHTLSRDKLIDDSEYGGKAGYNVSLGNDTGNPGRHIGGVARPHTDQLHSLLPVCWSKRLLSHWSLCLFSAHVLIPD